MNDTAPEKKCTEAALTELIARVRLSGAADAAVISAADISVEDDLARLCREPQCENRELRAFARVPAHQPSMLHHNIFQAPFPKARRNADRAAAISSAETW